MGEVASGALVVSGSPLERVVSACCKLGRQLAYTYMNQEWVHLFGIVLKPTVRFEAIAVFAKELGVPMEDPGIDTEDNLERLISIV